MLGGKHGRTRFDEGFGFVRGSCIKDGVNYSIPIPARPLLSLFSVLSLESKAR